MSELRRRTSQLQKARPQDGLKLALLRVPELLDRRCLWETEHRRQNAEHGPVEKKAPIDGSNNLLHVLAGATIHTQQPLERLVNAPVPLAADHDAPGLTIKPHAEELKLRLHERLMDDQTELECSSPHSVSQGFGNMAAGGKDAEIINVDDVARLL